MAFQSVILKGNLKFKKMIVGCPLFVLKLLKILYSNSITEALLRVVLGFTLRCTQSSSTVFFFMILKKDQIAHVQAEQATRMPIVCFCKLLIVDFLCKWDFSGSWLVLLLNEDMTFSSNGYQRSLDAYSKSFLGVLRMQRFGFVIWLLTC